MNYVDLRKILALAALIIDGFAISLPDPYSRFVIGVATGLNAASLYLIKEEVHPDGSGPTVQNEASESSA